MEGEEAGSGICQAMLLKTWKDWIFSFFFIIGALSSFPGE